MAEEAIALAPNYAPTYRLLGWTYSHDLIFGWSKSPKKSLSKAEEMAQKALSLGDDNAYNLLSGLYLYKGQFEKAVAVGEKGLALSPNWANYNAMFSFILTGVGRDEEAMTLIKKAIRLNPHSPVWYLEHLGLCYFNSAQYEKAIETSKQGIQISQNYLPNWITLVASYSLLDRDEDALGATNEILKINPNFSLKKYSNSLIYKNPARKRLWLDALRKSGLPE